MSDNTGSLAQQLVQRLPKRVVILSRLPVLEREIDSVPGGVDVHTPDEDREERYCRREKDIGQGEAKVVTILDFEVSTGSCR